MEIWQIILIIAACIAGLGIIGFVGYIVIIKLFFGIFRKASRDMFDKFDNEF